MPETSVAQRHSPTLVYRDWGDTTRVQLRDFSPLLPWRATEVWVWQVLGGVSVFQATGKHWQPKSCEATLEIQLPLKYSMKYCISSWVCIGPFYWLSKVVGFCSLGVFFFCFCTYWQGTAFIYLLGITAFLALPYNATVCIASFHSCNFYLALPLHIFQLIFFFCFLSQNCNSVYFWSQENSKISFLKQTQGCFYQTLFLLSNHH